HFPDTSGEYKNIDSKILLRKTMRILREAGYEIGNIDATIAAEQPKLNPHIPDMQKTLAGVMEIPVNDLSIKATTTEKLGFTGRREGIAAYAVALIK
ncbi:MAG TPA: 2-C-methyl-D-erythritol 2,4-cyclodiphosphate synthase, partial [Porphyromonadaceae bacterium]|nr:2-C-methyl-D-erythritol 2,4-cyclodiphosphate synthase [Porphyromonadaceae bacterium]